MPAKPLTAFEREEIRAGIVRGDSDGTIAGRIGRHRSTVNAEINRSGGRTRYRAVAAQARADRCRARPKTALLAADRDLGWYVTKRLLAGDSPMTISIELGRGTHGRTAVVSHETIYQAVYGNGQVPLVGRAWRLLHRRRRCRKHRGQRGARQRPNTLGVFNKISDRPAAAAGRHEVGHLEGDLIIGARNRSAVITIFDRATRHLWLAGFDAGHYNAETTAAAVTAIINQIPARHRRTLTWDRGTEMTNHPAIAAATGIAIYFCDPHSPWQRPTNENGNGLIRRWLPKGTDLSIHTTADLARIAHRINTVPRRSLNWHTAHDRYHAAVAMTG